MPSPFPSTMWRKTREVGVGGRDCLPWGTPLYQAIQLRALQHERVWVIGYFGHKQGIYFVQFSLKKGLIFTPSLKLCLPLRRSGFSNHYQFNKFMAVFQASVFFMVCKFLAPCNLFLYLLKSSKRRSFLCVYNLLYSMFYCTVSVSFMNKQIYI